MLPTIATGNVGSALAGEYEVANSLRFERSSSDYLSKTFGSGGNRKTATQSFWFKRSLLSTNMMLGLTIYPGGSYYGIQALTDDVLDIYLYYSGSAWEGRLKTNRVFRDTNAWYHFVLAWDTTQSTASDRFKLYVNGVQETSFQVETYPNQNQDLDWNNNIAHQIMSGGGGTFSGYLSEFCFIDGQALTPTSFGEFDEDTGIWKPIDVSGLTFGTNGFYLDFENSSSLGADVSGNGNNFTVNNLTSIDQSIDTCTNNFATLNPLVPATSVGFSNGNLTFTGSRSGNWSSVVSTFALSSGKWYAEFKINSSAGLKIVGVEPAEDISDYNDNHAGHTADGRGYEDSNGYLNTNGSSSSWGATYGNGDIIGVALDMDNRYVYFSKNGTFQNSGDPTSGSSGTGSAGNQLASKDYYFVLSGHESSGNTVIEANFGSPSFSISSGNSDGNGYGNFEYSVPSGYYALNTKNLAEYG